MVGTSLLTVYCFSANLSGRDDLYLYFGIANWNVVFTSTSAPRQVDPSIKLLEKIYHEHHKHSAPPKGLEGRLQIRIKYFIGPFWHKVAILKIILVKKGQKQPFWEVFRCFQAVKVKILPLLINEDSFVVRKGTFWVLAHFCTPEETRDMPDKSSNSSNCY